MFNFVFCKIKYKWKRPEGRTSHIYTIYMYILYIYYNIYIYSIYLYYIYNIYYIKIFTFRSFSLFDHELWIPHCIALFYNRILRSVVFIAKWQTNINRIILHKILCLSDSKGLFITDLYLGGHFLIILLYKRMSPLFSDIYYEYLMYILPQNLLS